MRNSQNFAIVLNSHLRKIMEECGVHPFYVDEVSRNFAIEIEKCTSSVQVSDLAVKMIKTYCASLFKISLVTAGQENADNREYNLSVCHKYNN